MSYGVSAALQGEIYRVLSEDSELAALVGDAIYDAPPSGNLPETYLAIGAEDVRDRAAFETALAEHRVTLSVVSSAPGFTAGKAAAGAASRALSGASLVPSEGHVVAVSFLRARARRQRDDRRRIDLTFRILAEDS